MNEMWCNGCHKKWNHTCNEKTQNTEEWEMTGEAQSCMKICWFVNIEFIQLSHCQWKVNFYQRWKKA